jgi:hypothetical protein
MVYARNRLQRARGGARAEEVAIYQRTMERYRESAMWREEARQWIQNSASTIG